MIGLEGMEVAGRADGRHLLDFPSGRFDLRTGDGEVVVSAPEGQRMQGRELIDLTGAPPAPAPPLDRDAPLGRLPIVADLHYSYQGGRIDVARSYAATPETYVEFSGSTEALEASTFDFHVTSRDWQESDRLLAGIMTAAGARTRPVAVGGSGTFDGTMTGRFRAPRIEGQFAGRNLRGWDVNWGTARTSLVVENSYVDIADAEIENGDARMRVQGRFSLGFPRRDGGEEMRARIQMFDWPLRDLRHAFVLDDYPGRRPAVGRLPAAGRLSRAAGIRAAPHRRTASPTTSRSTPPRRRSVSMASACSSTTSSSPSPAATSTGRPTSRGPAPTASRSRARASPWRASTR